MTTPDRRDIRAFGEDEELDWLFGHANPNPERIGCPPHDVLVALARRERPIGDPAYDHLGECSPCYREVRALQRAFAEEPAPSDPPAPPEHAAGSRRLVWLAAAAALVAFLVVAAWLALGPQRDAISPGDVSSEPQAAALDLRPYAVTRGDEPRDEPPPLTLPRGIVDVTIHLPAASEPGRYEVQILDVNQQPRASVTADAAIRDFVTTARATMDLRSLPPGAYHMAVRREGYDRRLFPVTVQ